MLVVSGELVSRGPLKINPKHWNTNLNITYHIAVAIVPQFHPPFLFMVTILGIIICLQIYFYTDINENEMRCFAGYFIALIHFSNEVSATQTVSQ